MVTIYREKSGATQRAGNQTDMARTPISTAVPLAQGNHIFPLETEEGSSPVTNRAQSSYLPDYEAEL